MSGGGDVQPALWAEGLRVREGVGVEVVDVGAGGDGGLDFKESLVSGD